MVAAVIAAWLLCGVMAMAIGNRRIYGDEVPRVTFWPTYKPFLGWGLHLLLGPIALPIAFMVPA